VELAEEGDGTWSAIVPLLPGCASSGDSIQEALEYVEECSSITIADEIAWPALGSVRAATRWTPEEVQWLGLL
jgi:hypothetical protein